MKERGGVGGRGERGRVTDRPIQRQSSVTFRHFWSILTATPTAYKLRLTDSKIATANCFYLWKQSLLLQKVNLARQHIIIMYSPQSGAQLHNSC